MAADDDMPAIRDFDLATIETLGRAMYEQDQFARKAADVVFAERSEDVRRVGWIAGSVDGKPRIRFIRQGTSGLEALYDVVFAIGQRGALSDPADRALSADEIAQYEARLLAIAGAAKKCSPSYDTVALKDPAGGGWLVWALAATGDPDAILVGGHFRFTISADGKTVQRRDEMMKSCLRFSRDAMVVRGDGFGGYTAGLLVRHLVALKPVETQVFSNLTYDIPVIVGTMDGLVWRIDGGTISNIDMDMPGVKGFAARTMIGLSERCKFIARSKIDERYITAGDPKIILETEGDGPYEPELPLGYAAEAVMCARLDIVPAPNDYKVVVAGIPVHLIDIGVGHQQRMGIVEAPSGRFRFRLTEGPALTDDINVRMTKRLDGFDRAARGQLVSMLSLDVSRGNLVETLYRLGHVIDPATGARADLARGAVTELSGYITANAAGDGGFAFHAN